MTGDSNVRGIALFGFSTEGTADIVPPRAKDLNIPRRVIRLPLGDADERRNSVCAGERSDRNLIYRLPVDAEHKPEGNFVR